jgi:phenylacetate-CoA ligase
MSIHSFLVRNIFHPLWLCHDGHGVQLRYQREFQRTQYLPADQLRDLQWLRLQRLLEHAYEPCPFYRRRFQQAGVQPGDLRCLEDLHALPPLTKAEIQEHGPELVAQNWPKKDLIFNQTGGSTGTPLSFYMSRDRYCSRAAATVRHNAWAGWRTGDKAALIWGAPRDRPDPDRRSRLRDYLLREPVWLDASHLTPQRMQEFHTTLCGRRPRVILAYSRALVLFARYLQSEGLTPWRPHALVTSAEVLEDDERLLLEDVFGSPVFNRYGCREVSVIASECPAHSGLHVMAEGLYLEIETPRGRAVPGELGSR